jgi:hypothetical protein
MGVRQGKPADPMVCHHYEHRMFITDGYVAEEEVRWKRRRNGQRVCNECDIGLLSLKEHGHEHVEIRRQGLTQIKSQTRQLR